MNLLNFLRKNNLWNIRNTITRKDFILNLLRLSPVILFTIVNCLLVKDSFKQDAGLDLWSGNTLWAFKFIILQYILIIIITAFLSKESPIFKASYFPNHIFRLVIYLFIIWIVIGFIIYLFERDYSIFFGPVYLYCIFGPLYFYIIPFHLFAIFLCMIKSSYQNEKAIKILGIICLIILLCTFIFWYKQLKLFMWIYHAGLVI